MACGVICLYLVGAASTPCAELPSPSDPPDPALARIYYAVGESERRAGAAEAAQVAYQEALRLDPANAAAREGLRASCQGTPARASREAEFEKGLALMNAGDRRGAILHFETARAGEPYPSAALLEGICLRELGEVERARPLLLEAEGDLRLRSTADFFLGLMALDEGKGKQAAFMLESAGRDPGLRSASVELTRLARREGKLSLSLLGEAGFDSNASLAPDGSQPARGPGDAVATVTGALLFQPFGRAGGPFLQASGLYRGLLQLNQLELFSGGGAAGWRMGAGQTLLRAEYGFDALALGNAPYLAVHHLQADARIGWGAFGADATYTGRLESYSGAAYVPYSGVLQEGTAEGLWVPSLFLRLGLGYQVGRDGTQAPELAWWEQGPRANVHLRLGDSVRLSFDVGYTRRAYDTLDASLGVRRFDVYWDAGTVGEVELGNQITLRAVLSARRATSNAPDFTYTRLTATLGLTYAAGLL